MMRLIGETFLLLTKNYIFFKFTNILIVTLTSIKTLYSIIRNDVTHLFECFCEVVGPSKENTSPWILQKFPEHYRQDEMLKTIPNFAYPCDFDR